LASRGLRFTAAIIDGVIAAFVMVPLMFFSGYWDSVLAGDPPSYVASFGIAAAAMVVFVVIHGYWLAKHGQTIGKRVVGIRIVNVSDELVPAFTTLVGARYGVVWLASLIPGVGVLISLIDDLFIFRSDRRCLHDLIAGTKVVTISENAEMRESAGSSTAG
jgi:uncharacterized RDD family membrane protein YckC